ncbi:MAG: hypothetical protein KC505_10355, partial [Myxococcales bacterium]|nr:hypothetical protein [Myxococcales bacterium]
MKSWPCKLANSLILLPTSNLSFFEKCDGFYFCFKIILTFQYAIRGIGITSFFTGKSSKPDSRSTEPKSRAQETRSREDTSPRGQREREDHRKDVGRALGEALPWYSSGRSSQSSRSARDEANRKEIEISAPTGFRKTTDEALSKMNPEDAQKIRSAKALESARWEKKEASPETQKAI